jgi:hypothetical protein
MVERNAAGRRSARLHGEALPGASAGAGGRRRTRRPTAATAVASAVTVVAILYAASSAIGAGSTVSVDIPIVANPAGGTTSSDDAEQRAANAPSSPNGMHLGSSDLDMLSDLGTSPLVPMAATGLRFVGVSIPQGRTITNAYVQFTAAQASSDATNLTVQAQAIDNAPTFGGGASNITNRARTTASVSRRSSTARAGLSATLSRSSSPAAPRAVESPGRSSRRRVVCPFSTSSSHKG